MRGFFYARLAVGGMRKNARLYLPYHLTCIGVAAMFYIILTLSLSPEISALPGGGTLTVVLGLGTVVIGVFSLLFLFYTSSFLARRRNMEFGLYNVLGLDRKGVARILLWETLITALVTLTGGLAAGMLLARLFVLGLMRIMGETAGSGLFFSGKAAAITAGWFLAVLVVMLICSVCRVRMSSAAALLRSESFGEKPPRANWLLAVLGLAILAAAYYLAVSIEDPIAALLMFFVAVLMVIAATYLLFIAGSVALCRVLRGNKRFYYTPRHFVPVASMAYRMKRNGAGLASICILATMVLVMISSTTCLYSGAEDSIRAKYPRNISLNVGLTAQGLDGSALDGMRAGIGRLLSAAGAEPEGLLDYRYTAADGVLTAGNIDTQTAGAAGLELSGYSDAVDLCVLPLEDYLRMTGAEETLAPSEVLIFSGSIGYNADTFSVDGGRIYTVKRELDSFPIAPSGDAGIMPEVYAVVPGIADIAELTDGGSSEKLRLVWSYDFDSPLDGERQSELTAQLSAYLSAQSLEHPELLRYYSAGCAFDNREDFYATYGGLFFLGIVLSIVFIAAAVLIIYYKQICEGYEDRRRFDIMQRVGMTRREIRQSINAQLLMVFFLPLLMAGLHLGFAFPFVRRLLLLFSLNNVPLLIGTTCASFLAFALLYTLVYRITSNTYYSIVSGAGRD